MYFALLLQYNARVGRQARQLTRRMSASPDFTLAEALLVPSLMLDRDECSVPDACLHITTEFLAREAPPVEPKRPDSRPFLL
jgi:hypothetical protein